MRGRGIGLASSLMLTVLTAVGAVAWPEVVTPPRATVERVSSEARVNGLPSRVDHFDSELSTDEVLDFYRRQWAHAALGPPREAAAGGWRSVSTLQGSFQIAVQVRPQQKQGSEGLISVANFADFQRDFIPEGWPRWSDAPVIQVTESTDGPRRSQMVSMASRASLDLNMRRWRDEWQRRGYRLTYERMAPAEGGGQNWLASFDKPPMTLDVTMAYRAADRQTFISANLLSPTR